MPETSEQRKQRYHEESDRASADLLVAAAEEAKAQFQLQKVVGDATNGDDVRFNAAQAYRQAQAATNEHKDRLVQVHLEYVRSVAQADAASG